MKEQGPLLEALTHRLAECPPAFLLKPKRADNAQGIDVPAIVADHFRAIGGWMPPQPELARLTELSAKSAVNHLRLIAITTYLLHDDFFRSLPNLAPAMWTSLLEIANLADVVRAEDVVHDPDRREELVRVCLKCLGLRPMGETVEQAADRLNTLDSAERLKVMRQTREAEARARKIREQMAAEAARAAAARYSPE